MRLSQYEKRERLIFDESDAMLCPNCGGDRHIQSGVDLHWRMNGKPIPPKYCPRCGGLGYVPKAAGGDGKDRP